MPGLGAALMRSTPSEMARVALAVAAVLSASPVFDSAVAEIQAIMKSPAGYERPTGSMLQSIVERQLAPEVPGAEGLLVAERDHIAAHIDAALRLAHPLEHLAIRAQPDLVDAVKWVAEAARTAGAVQAARDQVTATLARLRRAFEADDAKLNAIRSPQAAKVQQDGHSMCVMAAAIKACGLPDELFTAHQCSGFPCVGDYPDSGWFRQCERPAEHVFETMRHEKHRERVEQILTSQAQDAAQRRVLEAVTRKTRAEVAKGVAYGPFSVIEVNQRLGEGCWRPLHGFGIEQGFESDGSVKYRRCDNAGRSAATNQCLSTHETISCEQPSFPALVAALFHDCGAGSMPLHHSTDDVELAYRRMAAAHPEASVVAIYDTDLESIAYYTMDGHNFGLASAVLSFNRHSQLMATLARRLYGVPCAAYFDDYDVTEPVVCGRSGKEALHYLHRLLGVPLAGGDKDVDPAQSNPFLGVITDLSRASEGVAVLHSKPARVARMIVEITRILDSGLASKVAVRRIAGKLEYTSHSASAGRFGRAAISVLHEWASRRNGGRAGAPIEVPPELMLALAFFAAVLPLVRPRVFKLRRAEVKPPIVVYTDARYSPNEAEPAQIGVVIYDPTDAAAPWRHSDLVIDEPTMARFAPKRQYVGPLEVLGGVAPYSSLPELFRGRDVIHFIDNTGALFGLAQGSSSDPDSARLIHAQHSLAAALDVNVWYEYVASGANIADLPSRGEFDLLEEMQSVRFEITLPVIGGDWSAVYADIFGRFAPRPTKGDKRRRAAIVAALASERKRARAE